MKFLPLIWSGLWRKPLRTCLTFFSVVVAFILFSALYGVSSGMYGLIDSQSANRVRVRSNDGYTATLPFAYGAQLAKMPHMLDVSSITLFGAYVGDPKNAIGAVALAGGKWESASEIRILPEHANAFAQTRTGAVVGRMLADKYGWKVGDNVALTSKWLKRDGTNVWNFDIVGFYEVPDSPIMAQEFFLRYDYLDEGRVMDRGTVNSYVLRTTDPKYNAEVARAVDQKYANSPYPTYTQTDREGARAAVKQMLDLELLVTSIVGASLFTLLFVAASMLMQSVRLRIPEFAVLKAIGISNRGVFLLIVAEAIVLFVLGAAVGIGVCRLFFASIAAAVGFAHIRMPVNVPIVGFVIAVAMALISSLLPALRSSRLRVAQGLARQG